MNVRGPAAPLWKVRHGKRYVQYRRLRSPGPLSRLVQEGGGPACGVYQIEPATEADCWASFLHFHEDLFHKIDNLLPPVPVRQDIDQLQTNLAYATAICRIVYRRSPLPLAAVGDRQGQGMLWQNAYNKGGAATVEHYMKAWQRAFQ